MCQRRRWLLLSKASKQELKIVDGELGIGRPGATLSIHLVSQLDLSLLDALDPLLDGLLTQELVQGHWLRLSNTINAVTALLLQSRIPVNVQQEHAVGSNKIQTNAAGRQGQKHHAQRLVPLVIELGLDLAALEQLDVAFDLTVLDAQLSELSADD